MKRTLGHVWRIVKAPIRIAVGAVLVLIGILGLLLPILPGWIFIIPGLALVTSGTRLGDWLRAKAHAVRARMKAGSGEGTSPRPDKPAGSHTPAMPPGHPGTGSTAATQPFEPRPEGRGDV